MGGEFVRKILFFITLVTIFVIAACQSIQNVENELGKIKNLDALDTFVKNVKNQKEAKVNYIEYGIEGQKGLTALTYDRKKINVSFRVDGKSIEEYSCENIMVKTERGYKIYTLNRCNDEKTHELLSIANK